MDPQMKKELRVQVQRFFLEFLQNFREPTADGYETDYYYIEQAKTMVQQDRKTLYVKYSHLEKIDKDAVSYEPIDLRIAISTKYMMVRDALNNAVPELLDSLLENSATYGVDAELQQKLRKVREQDELKYVAAFYDQGSYSGVRALRTDNLGSLSTICGTVTRTTEVKPELLIGTFRCNDCATEVTGVEQQFKVTFPAICTKKHCGNRSNWTLLGESRTTRWGDWQRIRLQENENEVPAGSMPRSLDVIVRDEVCERCKPGDKVMITGSLIVVPDVPSMMGPAELKSSVRRTLETRSDASYEGVRGLKSTGQRDLTYKLSFFGCFIDEDSEWGSKTREVGENIRSDEKVFLSQTDKDKFAEISEHVGPGGKKDCFDVLARAIAPAVHGHSDIKKGVLLMLIGGLPKKTDEGIKLRGDINVCVLGDPATAKSNILKWTSSFLPRAVFTSGKTSSAAGLTASVVKDADLDNEKVIEPGALMLADNGICCIDEFEQMDEKDRVAIHEAMEQQTITLAKAGIKATLNARASILASCLPKDTYYNPTRPLHKNVDMSPPIMSRFDLFFVIQDIHDVTTDNRVAQHILGLHRQMDEDISPPLSTLELQRYIRLARTFTPKVTQEARERLVKSYIKLREDRTYTRGACGVTVRQLESLIRLSEAIARVYLDTHVRVQHVQEAFDLQYNSLQRVQRENIDLGDMDDVPAPGPRPGEEAAQGEEEPAEDVQRPRGKVKISFAEYTRIGLMLVKYLDDQEKAGAEVTEEELINWYMEQIEEDLQTEAEMYQQHYKVTNIIKRMIEKDRVIIVYRQSEDPEHPEHRILTKHPNVPVDSESIGRPPRPTTR